MSKLKDLASVPRNLDTSMKVLLEGMREHIRSITGLDGRGQASNITESEVKNLVEDALAGYVPPSGGSGGGSGSYVPDYTEPPTPSGVSVTAGLSYLFIETDAPTFSAGHGYERTIVYGTSWPAGSPAPTFSSAVKMHEFIGTVSSFPVQMNTRYAIWLKWLTQDAVLSATPAGGANGFAATTGKIGNADLGDLIVQAGNLAAGAVTAVKFDAAIEPVTLYPTGSLPTTKSTSTIFYGDKLYRWSGSAYVATVPTSDLTGTVSDAQIAGMAASKVSGTLTDAQLAAISAAKITGQIIGTQITDGAVTTAKIFAGSITTEKIAADAITANEIAAGAVTASEIAAGAVTTAKLAAGAVTANEIAAGSITAGKIAANAITATELAADAVTAGKIAAGAITASKIAVNAIAVGSAAIENGAIVNAMLGNATIDGAKIANAAITDAHITNLSGTKINAQSITADQIAAGTIRSQQIAAGGITADRLDTRGLVVRDADGNALLQAGSAIDWTKLGGATSNLTGLGYVGDLNATRGAPAGTYVGGLLAESVESSTGAQTKANAAQSAAISAAATDATTKANAVAAASLQKAGDTITGRINLAVADGLFAGSDLNNGVYMGSNGLVGKKNGVTTVAIGLDGTALFGGKMTADAIAAVNTINIADGAIIVPLGAEWITPSGWPGFWMGNSTDFSRIVTTSAADLDGGGALIISTTRFFISNAYGTHDVFLDVYVDNVVVKTTHVGTFGANYVGTASGIHTHTPPPGNRTYGLGMRSVALAPEMGGAAYGRVTYAGIAVMGGKR